jgi:hypothetical protein
VPFYIAPYIGAGTDREAFQPQFPIAGGAPAAGTGAAEDSYGTKGREPSRPQLLPNNTGDCGRPVRPDGDCFIIWDAERGDVADQLELSKSVSGAPFETSQNR